MQQKPFTIVEKGTNKVLRCQFNKEISENEILIEELCTELFKETFFNHETKTFYGEKYSDVELKEMYGDEF